MRKRIPLHTLLLTLITLLFTACSRPVATDQPPAAKVSLEQVRHLAEIALDGTLPGKQRQQARDDAMATLLAFLKLPESVGVPKEEWEKPLKTGPQVMRTFTTGEVRVYSLTLPASGIVPPGERVAVQVVPSSGAPQASELEVMPGGQLMVARWLAQARGQSSLTLAFGLAKGGGYVAHYQSDGKSGEFKQAGAAFRGLPSRVGDVTLDQRDGFLVVTTPLEGMWRPQFEEKQALRLFVTADIALDWKVRFELVDERNFNAFQGFVTALDPKASEADRREAWEKATHKLPAYLQEMPSWTDDLAAKLPRGARVRSERLANLEVRVVSVPAPDLAREPGFTVVQYRTGNGMPSAQVVALPGVMDDFQLVNQNGLPGLLMLSGAPAPKGVKRSVVSYLRMTGDNTWAPAPDWIGSLPSAPGVRFAADSGNLMIEGGDSSAVQLTGTPAPGSQPAVQVCPLPNTCFNLTWSGTRLGGAGLVVERLKLITSSGSPTYDQVLQAAEAVRQFLQVPDTRALGTDDLAAALGRSEGIAVAVFDASPDARVVGMPPTVLSTAPLLVQTGGTVLLEPVGLRSVAQWVDAREVQAGGDRWLLVLGRSPVSAAVVVYKWDGKTWQPANALEERVDRLIMERVRISYAPGQSQPVRGLYASGAAGVSAAFTPDGQGVQFCERANACVTYLYANRWLLK